MNYKDLQNISYLSHQILTEASSEEHNVMNRWPYASPYLQEERAPGVKPYKPGVPPMSYSKAKPPSGEKGDGSGYGADKKFTQDTDAKSFRPGVDVPKVKKFGRISRSIPHGIGDHANRTQSRVSTIVGKDPGAPKSEKMPPQEKKKPSREIIRKGKQEESFDLYDLVLAHLLDEGYADTYEAAEAIMVNMSEEWRESICEEYDMYEERKDLPVSRMSKQARRKAFRLGNEINDPESGIGLNVKSDPTAKQLRNMSRVGGKKVKHHIKKGYEQGSLYEPDNVELNWKRTHR
jgi:hypothetical protein